MSGVVIIGGGHAAGQVAASLRQEGYEGAITVMGDDIVSTHPKTGALNWTVKVEGDLHTAGGFLAAPPAQAGEMLVIATLSGEIWFLDPKDGSRKRTLQVGAPLRSQPVVDGGWVYVGTEDGRLIGIDTGNASLTGWPMWGGSASRNGK